MPCSPRQSKRQSGGHLKTGVAMTSGVLDSDRLPPPILLSNHPGPHTFARRPCLSFRTQVTRYPKPRMDDGDLRGQETESQLNRLAFAVLEWSALESLLKALEFGALFIHAPVTVSN
jgi:hypothetical protein